MYCYFVAGRIVMTVTKTIHYLSTKIGNLLINLLKPSGHYMYRQFNIQQFYVLLTVYLCVLCGSENKQRLFPYTALTD